MKIFVNASDIAAVCGMHKYRPSETALVDIWIKNYRSESKGVGLSSKQVLAKKSESLSRDVMHRLVSENIGMGSTNTKLVSEIKTIQVDEHGVPKDGRRAGSIMAEVLTERAKLVSKIKSTSDVVKLDQHLSDVLPATLLSEYTGVKHCTRGIANETRDISKYEETTGDVVIDRNDKVFRKVILNTTDDAHVECEYVLSGCVDGITNGDTIVESKNRMRRLFHSIPEYEQVQLEVYMWLTGLKKAILVENYDSTQSVLHYEHSPSMWSEIVMNFELFHENLQLFRADPNRESRAVVALMNKRT